MVFPLVLTAPSGLLTYIDYMTISNIEFNPAKDSIVPINDRPDLLMHLRHRSVPQSLRLVSDLHPAADHAWWETQARPKRRGIDDHCNHQGVLTEDHRWQPGMQNNSRQWASNPRSCGSLQCFQSLSKRQLDGKIQ